MITLRWSQLLYFIYLQTPFTHGEDGIQGIPPRLLFEIFNLAKRRCSIMSCSPVSSWFYDLPHHQQRSARLEAI